MSKIKISLIKEYTNVDEIIEDLEAFIDNDFEINYVAKKEE